MKKVNEPMIKIHVDTSEAQEKIEALKLVVEGCTQALENLGEAMSNLGSQLKLNGVVTIGKESDKE
ncbi:hypothetical protein [Bacillus sp. NPDC094106]|uniref:hypothetical protein n=1 Tax=Bacillus sp. NPDC094106 TaxID=3363949 RepID=UPI00380E10A4